MSAPNTRRPRGRGPARQRPRPGRRRLYAQRHPSHQHGAQGAVAAGRSRCLTSSIEHNALWRPLKALERRGVQVTAAPCAADGSLGPADVVAVTVEGYVPDQLAAVLDQVFDVATRAGLRCAPQAHRTAGTVEAGALRFSPGFFNTAAEIDYAAEALLSILR